MNKEINSNIELIRIVAMILVIVLHILGQGGFLVNSDIFTTKYIILWGLEIGAYGAINLFAMATGYIYVYKKNINLKSLLCIWTQVVFYTILITILFLLFNPERIGIKDIIVSFCPIIFNAYWYVTAYFCLFIFIPYINKFIENMTIKEFKRFTYLLIVIFALIPTVVLGKDIFQTNRGASPLWLMIMYFIGALIRKSYHDTKTFSKRKCFYSYIGCTIIVLISKLSIEVLMINLVGEAKLGGWFIAHTSIFVVIGSISLFILILNIKLRKSEKYILKISPLVFGVYLIHTNPIIFKTIWKDVFSIYSIYDGFISLAIVCIGTISVFFICIIIEKFRCKLFEYFKINLLLGNLASSVVSSESKHPGD